MGFDVQSFSYLSDHQWSSQEKLYSELSFFQPEALFFPFYIFEAFITPMESCASSLNLIVSVSAFLAWWCSLLPFYIITTFFASPRGKCVYLMDKNRIWFRMIQIQFTHDGKNKTDCFAHFINLMVILSY